MSSPLTAAPTARRQAAFHKVAECLYRHESSGIYYALVKRSGKQFRRSLQTTDRQLAARRLTEFREKTRRLEPAREGSRMTLGELADRWINLVRGHLKPSMKAQSSTI